MRSWALGVGLLAWLACVWLVGARSVSGTSISFLAVGQGDCTVVRSAGVTVIIDDGPKSPYEDAGKQMIVPWLRAHGVSSVQAIFLSHPDGDHVGGTPAILAAYPEAKVVMSDEFEDDPAMEGHLESWGLPKEGVIWLPKFCEIDFGTLHGLIDCPDRPLTADTNSGSMFVRLSEGQGSVVLSGDAPQDVERTVERDGDWSSEILHAGHHGSRTASDPSWIATVHPKFAIVSVGRNNRYHLPNQEVLDRLDSSGAQILRTDQEGTITFDFDGTRFVRRD